MHDPLASITVLCFRLIKTNFIVFYGSTILYLMNSVIVACMWQKHRVSWREKRDKIHSNFQSITFFMSQKLRFSIWAHCGYLRLGHLLQIGLLEISILLKLILCYTGFSALASKRCHLFEETQCSTWVNRSWYTHYLNATRGYTHYIYLPTTKLPVSTANRISLILCFKKKNNTFKMLIITKPPFLTLWKQLFCYHHLPLLLQICRWKWKLEPVNLAIF